MSQSRLDRQAVKALIATAFVMLPAGESWRPVTRADEPPGASVPAKLEVRLDGFTFHAARRNGMFDHPVQDLRRLTLDGCPVDDATCREFAAFTQLEQLELIAAPISDDGLGAIVRLEELTYLDLRGTPVTDIGVAKLAALPRLVWLDLRGTRVTSAAARDLVARKPGLTVLIDLPRVGPSLVKAD